MKVLFLTNVPSPYRIDFFNELGKHCDLTVLYQKQKSSERNKKWTGDIEKNYTGILLKGISTGVDNAFCPSVVNYLNRSFDFIVICGNASPTEILAIEWCKLKKIPYILEGDGAFMSEKKNIKEIIKRHVITGAHLYFSTCEEHDKYYLNYGAPKDRIVRYRFSSLKYEDIIKQQLSTEEKKKIRLDLGIKESKILLSVGQFIHRKGFDVLLNSLIGMNKEIGVYIVGAEPTDEYIDIVKTNQLSNVHFEGFKTKEVLKQYYKAADVFVLPTREDIWGLVINEAMGYGLPIVTTTRCNAGLELVENQKNGYIVNVDDVDCLQKMILACLASSEDFGKCSLNKISEYTIETMAKDHINTFNKLMEDKK